MIPQHPWARRIGCVAFVLTLLIVPRITARAEVPVKKYTAKIEGSQVSVTQPYCLDRRSRNFMVVVCMNVAASGRWDPLLFEPPFTGGTEYGDFTVIGHVLVRQGHRSLLPAIPWRVKMHVRNDSNGEKYTADYYCGYLRACAKPNHTQDAPITDFEWMYHILPECKTVVTQAEVEATVWPSKQHRHLELHGVLKAELTTEICGKPIL